MKLIVPALAAALLVPAVAVAQGPRSPMERFALFTSCGPVNVEVFVTNSGGAGGITRESVEGMTTSRLREARIYAPTDQPAWSLLRVTVFIGTQGVTANTAQTVYIIRLRFMKLVYDQLSDPQLAANPGRLSSDSLGAALQWIHWAPTWESPRPGIGFYGGRRDDVITGTIGTMLDEFVTEYLRVNGESCP
ncbi:hypothetical protein [Candidatus Palauibacter sp.]|uniref:hypothetical protein n=1 Tax=Candidatus Palauibacter sp. TaxID=3101350 RepID=UPI003AF230FF